MSVRSLTSLKREADRLGVHLPAESTLAKYGLDLREWLALLDDADWACPICGREPSTGKYVTDHEHVRGWEGMEDDERKRYVRGVTCWTCNRYLLARDMSLATARRMIAYFERYIERFEASS